MTRDKRPTIRTVARAAGVHPSTVSRVLAGPEPIGRISQATADHIRATAKRLGYVANPWAASLTAGFTRSIGVVVPNITDPVHAALCSEFEQIAFQRGYQVTIVSSHDQPTLQQQKVEYLLERRVDGLIITDAHLQNPLLGQLDRRGVPYVLALRYSGKRNYVGADDFRGGWLAGDHLCQMGHRNLGLISGMSYASTARERAEGFAAACAAFGIPLEQARCAASGFDVRSGYQTCLGLLERNPQIEGIFAVTDLLALGAMAAVQETGRIIGSGVAIVGYNDLPLAAMLPISLTSVRVPLRQIAESSVDALLTQLSGSDGPKTIKHEVQLLVRASTRLGDGAARSRSADYESNRPSEAKMS